MITCDKCAFCSKTQGGSLYCAWTDHFVPNIGCEDGQPITKVVTNADRLRLMSDEELAEWLLNETKIGYYAVCPPGTKDGEDCPTDPCQNCWLDWLKSPADKEGEG